MKKIISITLILAILLSCCFMLSGCADDPEKNFILSHKIKSDYIKQFEIEGVKTSEVLLEYYAGTYNGYTVAMLDASCHDFDEWQEKIGDNVINYPDTNRLLAYKDGKFITLTEAHASGALTDADITEIANKFNSDITVFYQICDEFDFFEECIYDIPELNGDYATDHVIVRMTSKFTKEGQIPPTSYFGDDIIKSVQDESPTWMDPSSDDYTQKFKLELHENSEEAVIYAVKRLREIPGIKSIIVNYRMYLTSTDANDSYYENGDQWGLDSIDIEKVWDFTTGSSSINVGIIDSGIAEHEDLSANLNTALGFDFANENNIATDDTIYHGTLMAGVIGAVGNNEIGVAGINWDVSLVPLQVISSNGSIYVKDVIKALEHSDAHDIPIINHSLVSNGQSSDFKEAIQSYSGLFVTSAGNDLTNVDNTHCYPGYYGSELTSSPLENIIVVGAIDQYNRLATWYDNNGNASGSNYGLQSVDIYAPGTHIYSTYIISNDNRSIYIYDTSTSIATTFVSGVAALLLSINPDLTTAQLKECILEGADQITITVPDGTTQNVKKLNAAGAFDYMFKTYMVSSYNIISCEEEVSVPINSASADFIDRQALVRLVMTQNKDYSFTVSGQGAPIDVVLYDDELNVIPTTQTKSNSNWTVSFEEELAPGAYYLYTKYVGMVPTSTVNISIDSDHSFTGWKKYSSTQHIEQCGCGATGTVKKNHVTMQTLEPGTLKSCLECGAIISATDGFGEIGHLSALKFSINGSYILPNGIIVLVDEDIEAYFNGTLVFYDKDELPETE